MKPMTNGAPDSDSQPLTERLPAGAKSSTGTSEGPGAQGAHREGAAAKPSGKAAKKPSPTEQLFEHFAHRARYVGDEETKRLKTQAKAVATGIRRLRDSFGGLMTAKQVDALTVAVRTLHELAVEADQASVIARKAKVDHDAEQLRRRHEKADRIAEARWGAIDDPAKKTGFMEEVHALVNFVDLRCNGASYDELKQLFGGRYFELEIEGGYSGPQLMRQLEGYEREPTEQRLLDMRRRAAEYVEALAKKQWNRVNLEDFEAWSAKRRASLPDLASIRAGRLTAPPDRKD